MNEKSLTIREREYKMKKSYLTSQSTDNEYEMKMLLNLNNHQNTHRLTVGSGDDSIMPRNNNTPMPVSPQIMETDDINIDKTIVIFKENETQNVSLNTDQTLNNNINNDNENNKDNEKIDNDVSDNDDEKREIEPQTTDEKNKGEMMQDMNENININSNDNDSNDANNQNLKKEAKTKNESINEESKLMHILNEVIDEESTDKHENEE